MREKTRWIAALMLLALSCGVRANAEVVVAFRLDDYSERSDLALYERVFQIFESRGLCCTVSVVPFVFSVDALDPRPQALLPLGEDKCSFLREHIKKGTVEPALHGYSHQTNLAKPGAYSEFLGLPPGEQERRLTEATKLIRQKLDQNVRIFCPPWNSYDAATLDIIEKLDYSVLTAARGHVAPAASKLRFVPCIADLHDALALTDTALRIRAREDLFVPVLFHLYDLSESGDRRATSSLAELEQLVDALRAQPGVVFSTVGRIAEHYPGLTALAYSADHRAHRWAFPLSLVPRLLLDETLPYPGQNLWASSILVRAGLLYAGAGVAGCLLGIVLVTFAARHRHARLMSSVSALLVAALALGLGFAQYMGGHPGYRMLLVLAVLCGILLPLAYAALRGGRMERSA